MIEYTKLAITIFFCVSVFSYIYVDSRKSNKMREKERKTMDKKHEEHMGAMSYGDKEKTISPIFGKDLSFILGYLKQSKKMEHEVSNERLVEILISIIEEVQK